MSRNQNAIIEGAELVELMRRKDRTTHEVAEAIEKSPSQVYGARSGVTGCEYIQALVRNYLEPLPDVDEARPKNKGGRKAGQLTGKPIRTVITTPPTPEPEEEPEEEEEAEPASASETDILAEIAEKVKEYRKLRAETQVVYDELQELLESTADEEAA